MRAFDGPKKYLTIQKEAADDAEWRGSAATKHHSTVIATLPE